MTAGQWLRILLYQDLPGRWVARSLEHDITIEDATMDKAIDWILRIVVAHAEFDVRHGRQPLSTFPGAPRHYWHAFEHATPLRTVVCGTNTNGSARSVLIAYTNERPIAGLHRAAIDTMVPISVNPLRPGASISIH